MNPTTNQIKEFALDLGELWVSDGRKAKALKARHLRGGKITKADSKEGAGVKVYAFAYNELGGICAWCKDGIIRQFI